MLAMEGLISWAVPKWNARTAATTRNFHVLYILRVSP
jgi:hypothetical protein